METVINQTEKETAKETANTANAADDFEDIIDPPVDDANDWSNM